MAKFGVATDHNKTIYILGGVTEGETCDSHTLLGTAYKLKFGETHWSKVAGMKSKKTIYEAVPCHEGTFITLPTGDISGSECEALIANHVKLGTLNILQHGAETSALKWVPFRTYATVLDNNEEFKDYCVAQFH